MLAFQLLAAAADVAAAASPADAKPAVDTVADSVRGFLTWPSQWPGLVQMLALCKGMSQGTATILIIAGLGFLAYGQSAHRMCMSMNCAVIGAWVGGMLGKQGNAIIPGMLIGGFLGGLIAWPMLKYSIQLIAGGVGFVAGSCIWRTFPNLAAEYAWAGGAIGSTFLFMLSHITLRWAVVIATGLQGAVMLILGVIGWLYQIGSIRTSVETVLTGNQYAMPLAVAIPAILGLVYQQHQAAAMPPEPPPKK